MTMERIQFIGVLVWMIGMLVMVIWAMRDLIKSENAEHEQRQSGLRREATEDKAAQSIKPKN